MDAGALLGLEHQDVAHASRGQVVGRGGAGKASSDDDNVGTLCHKIRGSIKPRVSHEAKQEVSVRIEKQDVVTTVILDRPDVRNAVDRKTAEELAAAFREFDADPQARVAVLWGANGVFCAGADLKNFDNRVKDDGDGPMGVSRMMLGKPVIAAVAGHAVAGGLELAVWCDLRVAEEDAVFGVFCRRWGVPLIDGGTVRLPRLIGLSHALDMILTGRAVKADEALAMGLANRVVPKGKSREAAEALARQIAEFPQECMRNDRRSAHDQVGLELEAAIRHEFDLGKKSLASPDLSGGLGRFRGGQGRHGSFES
jgi:enoyl-CoA hydratase